MVIEKSNFLKKFAFISIIAIVSFKSFVSFIAIVSIKGYNTLRMLILRAIRQHEGRR